MTTTETVKPMHIRHVFLDFVLLCFGMCSVLGIIAFLELMHVHDTVKKYGARILKRR